MNRPTLPQPPAIDDARGQMRWYAIYARTIACDIHFLVTYRKPGLRLLAQLGQSLSWAIKVACDYREMSKLNK